MKVKAETCWKCITAWLSAFSKVSLDKMLKKKIVKKILVVAHLVELEPNSCNPLQWLWV